MVNFKTIILNSIIALTLFMGVSAYAKDKEYEFEVRGYVSEEINDQEDFALYEAAKYAAKKGFEYFTILNVRRYDKTKSARKMDRIGSRTPKRPRLRTRMVIHCYDADPGEDTIHQTASTIGELEEKYSS
ncbi:hypothetical protein [Pseudemcibacter aquimaris]|uniref:hypothetical protein n=1 Tax=Pseudemcibacter aquimaris TaxID=2857064 RepID=UPI0020114B5D|nr:hypothetical protein [Pseudemcibacter aquimaris]MCC3859827.1 hypothetical protein [Pseudemcibacter aquimaris]WDU57159.1 hypothetical protein KW060_08110 [Pseudemcibacter aquimaris]